MREYILTPQERKIIQQYLETDIKLEGYRVLLHRCKSMKAITDDLELIKKFVEKADSE